VAPGTFPWVFPYVREPRAASSPFADRDLLRPAVPLRFVGPLGEQTVLALVDSGSDHVFAAPWVAQAIGVDLHQAVEAEVLLGGARRRAHFVEAHLVLGPPGGIETSRSSGRLTLASSTPGSRHGQRSSDRSGSSTASQSP
jgi:hypothetical protein